MEALTPDELAPTQTEKKLYSVGQISFAAAFASPIAGGWLLARNFRCVGASAKARKILLVSFGALILVALASMYVPTDFPNSVGPAIIGSGFYAWYSYVFARHYRAHIESGGEKESTWKAIGYSIAAIPIAIIVMFAVYALVPITPMNYVAVGENSVYYEGGATREDAVHLGRFLTEQGVFYGAVGWEFGVDFPRSKPNQVTLKAPMEKPTEMSETYLAIQDLLDNAEQQLYPGRQITFTVLNEYGIPSMQITNE